MAKFIIFGNQKGGVGKSQCAIMAATALSQTPFNLRVLVCDLDKQESILRLRALDTLAYLDTDIDPAQSFTVQKHSVNTLFTEFTQIDENYDIVIFDAAGKLDDNLTPTEQEITPLLMLCDVLLVPVIAGNHVLNSTSEFLHHAQKIKDYRAKHPDFNNNTLNIYAFANMVEKGQPQKDLNDELKHLSTGENAICSRLPVDLSNYLTFRKSDTVQSLYNPYNKTAAYINFCEWLTAVNNTLN